MRYVGEPISHYLHITLLSNIAKMQTERLNIFYALIDTSGKKKLSSTQASFKVLFVSGIDVIFKSQWQLSLPLAIP